MVVGSGEEGNGLRVLAAKDRNAEVVGTCSCRTVGVTVLSLDGDGWARVGFWRQQDGTYTEGYVAEKNLEVVWPNTRYGAVIDKQAQTMTFYEEGRRLGSILVSTGLVRKNFRYLLPQAAGNCLPALHSCPDRGPGWDYRGRWLLRSRQVSAIPASAALICSL